MSAASTFFLPKMVPHSDLSTFLLVTKHTLILPLLPLAPRACPRNTKNTSSTLLHILGEQQHWFLHVIIVWVVCLPSSWIVSFSRPRVGYYFSLRLCTQYVAHNPLSIIFDQLNFFGAVPLPLWVQVILEFPFTTSVPCPFSPLLGPSKPQMGNEVKAESHQIRLGWRSGMNNLKTKEKTKIVVLSYNAFKWIRKIPLPNDRARGLAHK